MFKSDQVRYHFARRVQLRCLKGQPPIPSKITLGEVKFCHHGVIRGHHIFEIFVIDGSMKRHTGEQKKKREPPLTNQYISIRMAKKLNNVLLSKQSGPCYYRVYTKKGKGKRKKKQQGISRQFTGIQYHQFTAKALLS